MASSRMTSGEKLRMVSDSNQLFLKLVKSLQEEHAEELRNNRILKNKLYYTRQDYSKNEKKLKRSRQQLANAEEDVAFCKQEIAETDDKIFDVYSRRVAEQGSLVDEQIQHQRLCTGQEKRDAVFKLGQEYAKVEISEKAKGKGKIRCFLERLFGMKRQQEKKLNADINSMLSDDAFEARIQVAKVLKSIQKKKVAPSSSASGSDTEKLAARVLYTIGY